MWCMPTSELLQARQPATGALVDAPCSNLGVLASRPTCAGAPGLSENQLGLLRAAIARVRPGGTVVYSTCTLNAEENEAVVDRVVAEGHIASLTRPPAVDGARPTPSTPKPPRRR